MGWFWGNSNGSDPTKNLDPSLKDFLQQETPARYDPTTIQHSSPPEQKQQPSAQQTPTDDPTAADQPSVPSASLFPDGRYAHLWKDYRPAGELESSSMSPAERVIDQFKKRKEVLNKAALENCSEEQFDLSMCFKSGTVKERATMCSAKNSKFSRCYTMQIKFLQALGYASAFEFDPDKEERIQMHADKLYHQMLEYEQRVEEAKAAGQEPPPPQSLFKPNFQPTPTPTAPSTSTTTTTTTSDSQPTSFSDLEIPGGEKVPVGVKFKTPLKDMTPHERELELQVLQQKRAQQGIYLEEVGPVLQAENQARDKRREKLSGWFGETIGKFLA
ncbi:hypothetical protein AJ78_03905 [Emergomyces pasteurianus Ep9510]|uniref:Uncharacterized protein n=1 Tax=Emergomyces pasteurianus Ep9510 TaxID=1447872 RepID=A0A1J9QI99_9EURO|nr:hypothetical protein AJ78_03905 [Emergomyces pasteurianus Ep9510]